MAEGRGFEVNPRDIAKANLNPPSLSFVIPFVIRSWRLLEFSFDSAVTSLYAPKRSLFLERAYFLVFEKRGRVALSCEGLGGNLKVDEPFGFRPGAT